MGLVTDIFLPLALAFIMFSLGLSLTLNDFIRIAKQPKDFFVGEQLCIFKFTLLFLMHSKICSVGVSCIFGSDILFVLSPERFKTVFLNFTTLIELSLFNF